VRGELFSLALFTLLGVMTMISANNLLVIYLGLELQSLALYALVALQRDQPRAGEAAMKYFVLGGPGVRIPAVRDVDAVWRHRDSGHQRNRPPDLGLASGQPCRRWCWRRYSWWQGSVFKLGAAPFSHVGARRVSRGAHAGYAADRLGPQDGQLSRSRSACWWRA